MRGPRAFWGVVAAVLVLVTTQCGEDKGSGPDDNEPVAFSVELENFVDHYDVAGTDSISARYCGGASGSLQVVGMDTTGEWIEVPLHVTSSGTYEARLRYQANPGVPVRVAMTVEGCGSPSTAVEFTLDQADGIG